MDMNDSSKFDFYLASASPRRRDLLNSLGFEVKVCPSDIDETPLLDELPIDYVQRLSLEKARTAYEKTAQRQLRRGSRVAVGRPGGFKMATKQKHMLHKFTLVGFVFEISFAPWFLTKGGHAFKQT